ncbi:MAG: endonuclease/exonuclease/phosphatase family protein [Alphaproteobacteria bacterium]|nr:endonuclease/exonuclease/phosphatase family protein [Alphaproteobacteria bacterium]
MIAALLVACSGPSATDPVEPASFRAITFNTGTTEGLAHDPTFDGYGDVQAAWSDQYYGDGLAWAPAVDAVAAFLAGADADIVAFQEIFDPADCATIPADAQAGFYCDGWDGGATVAEHVTGADYQVVCHPGKPDKCVAVHERLGAIAGPMEGFEVEGCGSGARVARIDIPGVATVVSVHGNSGLAEADQACRAAQVEAIFAPGGLASGDVNLILGDLNTDPGRWVGVDTSAAAWDAHVGEGTGFHWITAVGPDSEPSYQGIVTIDHMASDTLVGDCFTPGVTAGTAPVYAGVYFDHHPVVCDLVGG